MLITSKGQITIPQEYRDGLGFLPHTHVEFERVGNELRVKKAKDMPIRSSKLIEHMVNKGSAVRMTTDEIMQLMRNK